MIKITLPDGSQRPFEHPVTVAEVAASIGAGLAKAALAGKVDGKLVDTSFRIENDAALEIVTEKHPDALRSCAIRPRTCWRRRCSACIPARRSRSAR
jgi:threonyl-tRNA synthetase